MKLILIGSTGFVGREVLNQCLETPSITSIVALSRSKLQVSHPKLQVILIEDFLFYPESVLQDTRGATACIWSLGKKPSSDADEARRVCLDYTIAAIKAFTPSSGYAEKFRFVYLSGAATERDQNKHLLHMQDYRRMRGQVENELVAFATEHRDNFETCIMRPGFILADSGGLKDTIKSMAPSVNVGLLAVAMIRAAVEGSFEQTVENKAIAQQADAR